MKKLTLEATDENVLESIKKNTYNRTSDIKEFIEALDMIDGNAFISLDARWGEGKTFYVRQIEKTLEYIVKKTWKDPEDIEKSKELEELKPYFENTVLDSIDLGQSYLPIYYNAWLYDNHNDPLLSLLFIIAKKCAQYPDTSIDKKSLKEKFCSLVSSISVGICGVDVSIDAERINNAFSKDDILDEILTAEEIREAVKGIFNEVIVGNAQKLIVFIDELDRCRPSFAIEMLERIKHYFDDDRIIFIVSVNKEQLVHTISKYYGVGFDSTGYLNKFFDLNVHMPMIKCNDELFDTYLSGQYWLNSITKELSDYYNLSLRDALIFKQNMSKIPLKYVQDSIARGCCLSTFIPIITVLDIVDEGEKRKFLNGESEILDTLSQSITALYKMCRRFGDSSKTNQESFEIGYRKIKEVYDYNFGIKSSDRDEPVILEGCSNLKNLCLKLCSGLKK